MSNVASLENCQELYEVSGWQPKDKVWWKDDSGWKIIPYDFGQLHCIPAYTLGDLLRKLPKQVEDNYDLNLCHGSKWQAGYVGDYVWWQGDVWEAEIPEDALCLLSIELFKQGVLTK